ncbi:replication protein C, IncQ-type [Vibrio sp. 10N.261.52.F3]|uniref:replication protein C, IncQ-type n=1 Tax=Vibrio sp. 10N.261.52.F3 TaxID=3229683 RepID=UPI003553510D
MNTKKNKNKTVKYPVSRNLKMLHNASIFRPVKRGRRRVGVKHNFESAGTKVAIEMAEELDVADQDLMIGLFAIARSKEFSTLALSETAWVAENGKPQSVKKTMGISLGVFQFGTIPSSELRSIQISISKYELLKELGRAQGGKEYASLTKSLKRLASTTYHHDGEKWCGSFSMLSFLEDKESEHLLITINPVASYAIRKDEEGYVLQHRGERGRLKSEEARVLHSVICSLVDPNKQVNLNLKMLVSKVWGNGQDDWSRVAPKTLMERYGDDVTLAEIEALMNKELQSENPTIRKVGIDYEVLNPVASPKTVRNRMSALKKVLVEEINTLGSWSVEVVGRGDKATVRIRRKKATKSLLELSG